MTYKIIDIQGIGPEYAEKLNAVHIHTTDDLMKHATDAHSFKMLSEKTGISEKLFETWTRMAGLMRVNGIGPQYAELLYFSGVETVEQLQAQPVDGLLRKMAEVNTARKLTGALPNASDVHKWMENLKQLPTFETTPVR